MSANLGSARGKTSSQLGAQQLREKMGQFLTAAGHRTPQQKAEYLIQYVAKWSMNQTRLNHQQFIGALQSLHLPLSGAGEVFSALDVDGSGYVDIREFCNAMIGVQQPAAAAGAAAAAKPRLATRNAGSEIVMSGRKPSGGLDSSMQTLPVERGYTPVGKPQLPNKPAGSRNGSRIGTANRTPPATSSSQQMQMSTVKYPVVSSALPSKPQYNSAASTGIDFSEMIIEKFRAVVLNRGGSSGIHSLGRIFRIMDEDCNRRISLEELSYGLQDFGLRMSMKDLQLLLAAIDRDNTGALSFDEFLVSLRGVVNPRRQSLINMAFDVLDSTGDGRIQVGDLAARFDAQGHPDVISGRMPHNQALSHFLSQFDSVDRDGTVTREEFLEYYRNVSASVDEDDFFELMIRNAWHITGGTGGRC
jgi:Ca2+-binding EF-hand superfamily protein